jgi:hypothetical protein
MEFEVVCYIGLLTLCCSHANVHVDHRDLLPAQVLLILVPHIDSRVKIIDNERPGASTHIILIFSIVLSVFVLLSIFRYSDLTVLTLHSYDDWNFQRMAS